MQYNEFIKRNSGYVSKETQDKIYKTKILIAGCGIGSTIAECLLRAGFINLTLVDFDTVELSNLNRQIFSSNQIGENKAIALKSRLSSIYPEANILAITEPLSEKNISQIVKNNDIIMDTIDFLDLQAILDLHDEAFNQKKPLVSMVSAGFGAIGFLISDKKDFLKKKMKIKESEDLQQTMYGVYLKRLLNSLKNKVDDNVLNVMNDVMDKLSNGIPCPAPHVSVGSFAAGSLATYLLIKFLESPKKNKLINKTHFLSLDKIL